MPQRGIRPRIARLYRRLEARRHELRYLFFEVTRRCNLRCRHCGSDCTSEAVRREMALEDWVAAADYIHNHFGSHIFLVLTGGEPLLFPGWSDLTKHLGKLGFSWGLVSNGTTLSGPVLDTLLGHGLKALTLSVDAADEDHDAFRGVPGTFRRLRAALELAGSKAVPGLDAVTCVHPGNLRRLDDIAHLLLETGIPAWRLFRIFPLGRAAAEPALHLDQDATRELLHWIRDARPRYAPRGLKVSYSCEGCLDWDLDRSVRDFPFVCRAGLNIAAILADGTFTGCSNNPSRFHQGNWFTHDLKTQWEQDYRVFRDRGWAAQGTCGNCHWWADCQGGSIHLWPDGATEPAFCYKGL
jgi:radical SAM protein with 4Fe4S-binding SPASM domain